MCTIKTFIHSNTRFPSGMCVTWNPPGVTQVDEKGHEGNTAVVTAYLCWRKHGQRNSRAGGVPADYYYSLWTLLLNKKTSAVRSRISSNLIFASCVGYFDRAYYGFYVTSSRMIVLIEGNEIWQLWNSVSVQIRSMWLWIRMRPYFIVQVKHEGG